jgi:predicted permease
MVNWIMVTPNYFQTLGIAMLRGRAFSEGDRSPSQRPVILNEKLAAKLFPDEDPLGKMLRFTAADNPGPWRTVIGIAANVKNNGLTSDSDPEFYIPWKNDPGVDITQGFATFHSSLATATVLPWLRSQIAQIDPVMPVEFSTMDDRIANLVQRPHFDALLLTLFAGISLLLAALGIYGVVNFFVSQRTQEIGIRMALGASALDISQLVLANVARWTLAGAAFGFLGAWFATRFLQSLLFAVSLRDPILFSSVSLALLAVVFLAAWIPALRATRVDPTVALRYE